MEFAVEAVSPTRKKVVLTLTAEDVDAAIGKAVAAYRKDLVLPGFRKGKVPASVVERRFGEEIRAGATSDTVNDAARKAFDAEGIKPLSRLDMEQSRMFEKGAPFTCSLEFDVLPSINFPTYEGLEVEETTPEMSEAEIADVLEGLRSNGADTVDVTETRLPQDGDVVDVDFAGFEPDDPTTPVADVKGEHFSITLGQKQALDDFEALVKTAMAGEEKEGIVNFPENYSHPALAGKKVLFRIRLNAIKNRILPDVTDEFARTIGYDDVEKLRAAIVEHGLDNKRRSARSEAMRKLLDQLLPQVTFDIPASLLESRIDRVLGDRAVRLQRAGQSIEHLGKSVEELREEAREEAREGLRAQVFLMALAEKENLDVTEQEVEIGLYTLAARAGQEYQKLRDAYVRSGLIYELRDRLLADKAMELVYSKAKVTHVKADATSETTPESAPAE